MSPMIHVTKDYVKHVNKKHAKHVILPIFPKAKPTSAKAVHQTASNALKQVSVKNVPLNTLKIKMINVLAVLKIVIFVLHLVLARSASLVLHQTPKEYAKPASQTVTSVRLQRLVQSAASDFMWVLKTPVNFVMNHVVLVQIRAQIVRVVPLLGTFPMADV